MIHFAICIGVALRTFVVEIENPVGPVARHSETMVCGEEIWLAALGHVIKHGPCARAALGIDNHRNRPLLILPFGEAANIDVAGHRIAKVIERILNAMPVNEVTKAMQYAHHRDFTHVFQSCRHIVLQRDRIAQGDRRDVGSIPIVNVGVGTEHHGAIIVVEIKLARFDEPPLIIQ